MEAMVASGRTRAHPLCAEWLGPPAFDAWLTERAESWLARARDAELANEYATHFPVAGAKPDEYRNRLFETPSGARLLAGIRFRNLDLGKPFVDVLWQEQPFTDARAMSATLEAVADAYRVFRPGFVRFEVSAHEPVQPDGWERVTLQSQEFTAPLAVVAEGTQVAGVERVTLEPARVADLYDCYHEEYEQLLAGWPELRDVASPESRDTLEEAESAGLCFSILVEGEAAGVYALMESQYGPGHYEVAEIHLFRAHRGRGLAPAAHVAAARRLLQSSRGLLTGTIGAVNAPSRRTALRVGRRCLKGTYRYHPTSASSG